VLLVSEGPDYDTADVMTAHPSDASRVVGTFAGAVQACADRDIPIHTLDPRGLVLPEGEVTEVAGEFGVEQNLSLLSENRRAIKALRDLSSLTGGVAIVERNDLPAGLADVRDAMSAYYVLGFTSSAPSGKRYHRLSVKVRRGGLRVIAREGYLRW
jgi:VWFA-related protein